MPGGWQLIEGVSLLRVRGGSAVRLPSIGSHFAAAPHEGSDRAGQRRPSLHVESEDEPQARQPICDAVARLNRANRPVLA